jgi:hypothetical protein
VTFRTKARALVEVWIQAMTGDEYRQIIRLLQLNQQEAGRWLGLSRRTAQNYARRGPPDPVARLLRVVIDNQVLEPADLEAFRREWLAEGKGGNRGGVQGTSHWLASLPGCLWTLPGCFEQDCVQVHHFPVVNPHGLRIASEGPSGGEYYSTGSKEEGEMTFALVFIVGVVLFFLFTVEPFWSTVATLFVVFSFVFSQFMQ